ALRLPPRAHVLTGPPRRRPLGARRRGPEERIQGLRPAGRCGWERRARPDPDDRRRADGVPRLHAVAGRAHAMRAWVIRGTGGLDQVQPADVPDLAGPLDTRQVRIALRAAVLNHLDLFVVRGLPHEYRYPHILGADGAGAVEAVGG